MFKNSKKKKWLKILRYRIKLKNNLAMQKTLALERFCYGEMFGTNVSSVPRIRRP